MLQIALLQLCARAGDQDANQRRGDAWCREAKVRGADVAVFPEMWNVGYGFFAGGRGGPAQDHPDGAAAEPAWLPHAIGDDDAFVAHFRRLAAELNMAIALTYLQRWPQGPRNVVPLIDRRGQIALTYAKVHTCVFDAEAVCTPGETFPVARVDTASGTVAVGAMICFDREFPESARILMLEGAELVVVPNACEMEANRLSQLRGRAYENMMGIALANYAAPQQNGHSVAFDGMAFDADGRSRDMCLGEAGDAEGVYMVGLDLDALRAYRRREVWGGAYRRPDRYAALVRPAGGVPAEG